MVRTSECEDGTVLAVAPSAGAVVDASGVGGRGGDPDHGPDGGPAAGVVPPLLTGGTCARFKNLNTRRTVLGCDRLELETYIIGEPDVLPLMTFGPWRRAKNRGIVEVFERMAWVEFEGSWIRFRLEKSSRHIQRTLQVQFSPMNVGAEGIRFVGAILGLYGDPLRAWVKRVDVAYDMSPVPRWMLRLDAGRCKVDQYGVTRKGPETEMVGLRWATDCQAVLYDKSAERRAAGESVPEGWCRFEVRRRGPLPVVGESSMRPLMVGELAAMGWPGPDGVCVREFVRTPDDYQDAVYALLAAAAWIYGTRAAEGAAAEVLGLRVPGSGELVRDQVRGCCWPTIEPDPLRAFDERWPLVAGELHEHLRAGVGQFASMMAGAPAEAVALLP